MRAAIAAGVVALLAVAGVVGWALLRDDAKATPKKRAAAPTTTTTTTAPVPVGAITATQKHDAARHRGRRVERELALGVLVAPLHAPRFQIEGDHLIVERAEVGDAAINRHRGSGVGRR